RVVERAYVYPIISADTGRDVGDMIDKATSFAADHQFDLSVRFAIKNFGKTPATITDWHVSLYFEGTTPVVAQLSIANPVLGAGEATDNMKAVVRGVVPGRTASAIFDTSALLFDGEIHYLDAWDEPQKYSFRYKYALRTRRFVRVENPRQ